MDAKQLNTLLACRAEEFCQRFFPNGRKEGGEWKIGDVSGSRGHSLGIQLVGPKRGLWKDRATDDGGTLLDLLKHQHGGDFPKAADEARRFLGLPAFSPSSRGNGAPHFDPLKFSHRRSPSEPNRYPSAAWAYHDASGAITAYVCRFNLPDGSKDILPLRLIDGHWRWKGWSASATPPELRPIYNLHLLKARPDAPVLIVEGEKTADAANRLFPDILAITWQGGAKAVQKVDWTPIRDRKTPIILWPDNDDAGQEAMLYLKARFPSAVRVTLPPGLPDGWDLADPPPPDISLRGLLDAALNPPPPEPSTTADESELPEASDAGRAELFINRFHTILRFVPEWNRWLVFEDRWNTRNTSGIERLAIQFAKEILHSDGHPKLLADRAAPFTSSSKVTAMCCFAQADKRVIVSPDDLDADPWLVGATNGVMDLRSGVITPHSHDRLVTRFIGCEIDPAAKCPLFLAFLNRILPDPEVRHYIHKAAGYSLTGLTREQHFMFLHGIGANGKSTLLETLFRLSGSYGGRAAESLLYKNDRNPTPPDVIAEIAGVRFLAGSETREGAKLNEGAIKDITGGDTQRGARKYEHGFSFQPVAKLWMAGNHRPTIQGNDDGIWRRVRLIDFPVQIPSDERDPELSTKLRSELPGILNWLVQGCQLWMSEGLKPPPTVLIAIDEYRKDEDDLVDFLAEKIEEFPPSSITHHELFRNYKEWARLAGVRYALSNRILAKRLRDRGWKDGFNTHGSKIWRGVRLREPITDDPEPTEDTRLPPELDDSY